jgi:hypothetical protein
MRARWIRLRSRRLPICCARRHACAFFSYQPSRILAHKSHSSRPSRAGTEGIRDCDPLRPGQDPRINLASRGHRTENIFANENAQYDYRLFYDRDVVFLIGINSFLGIRYSPLFRFIVHSLLGSRSRHCYGAATLAVIPKGESPFDRTVQWLS